MTDLNIAKTANQKIQPPLYLNKKAAENVETEIKCYDSLEDLIAKLEKINQDTKFTQAFSHKDSKLEGKIFKLIFRNKKA